MSVLAVVKKTPLQNGEVFCAFAPGQADFSVSCFSLLWAPLHAVCFSSLLQEPHFFSFFSDFFSSQPHPLQANEVLPAIIRAIAAIHIVFFIITP
jgi:hypothetical protein